MSKYIVLWKRSYLDKFNPSLFLSCTVKVTMLFFPRRFGRILYLCSNNGPLPNVIFSTWYLKNSLLDWRLKCKEMRTCLKIVDFTEFFLKLPEQCEKFKLKTLLLMTYVIFWGCAALLYHGNKHIDNLYKKISMYLNFFYSGLKILCLRKVQNFIDVP